jgi:hypothetical protein
MGFFDKLLGSADYPLDPHADAKARSRAKAKRAKAAKAQSRRDNKPNKRPTSDERGHGASGGGWFW